MPQSPEKKRAYMVRYGRKNKSKIAAKRRARYLENRPEELAAMRYRRKLNASNLSATRRAKHEANPLVNMLATAKTRARRRGIEFSIGPEDVAVPMFCPVLGIRLKPSERKVSDGSPTIDRINNARGYVPGNVIVVSFRANTIKSDATIAELRRVVAFYEKFS